MSFVYGQRRKQNFCVGSRVRAGTAVFITKYLQVFVDLGKMCVCVYLFVSFKCQQGGLHQAVVLLIISKPVCNGFFTSVCGYISGCPTWDANSWLRRLSSR